MFESRWPSAVVTGLPGSDFGQAPAHSAGLDVHRSRAARRTEGPAHPTWGDNAAEAPLFPAGGGRCLAPVDLLAALGPAGSGNASLRQRRAVVVPGAPVPPGQTSAQALTTSSGLRWQDRPASSEVAKASSQVSERALAAAETRGARSSHSHSRSRSSSAGSDGDGVEGQLFPISEVGGASEEGTLDSAATQSERAGSTVGGPRSLAMMSASTPGAASHRDAFAQAAASRSGGKLTAEQLHKSPPRQTGDGGRARKPRQRSADTAEARSSSPVRSSRSDSLSADGHVRATGSNSRPQASSSMGSTGLSWPLMLSTGSGSGRSGKQASLSPSPGSSPRRASSATSPRQAMTASFRSLPRQDGPSSSPRRAVQALAPARVSSGSSPRTSRSISPCQAHRDPRGHGGGASTAATAAWRSVRPIGQQGGPPSKDAAQVARARFHQYRQRFGHDLGGGGRQPQRESLMATGGAFAAAQPAPAAPEAVSERSAPEKGPPRRDPVTEKTRGHEAFRKYRGLFPDAVLDGRPTTTMLKAAAAPSAGDLAADGRQPEVVGFAQRLSR